MNYYRLLSIPPNANILEVLRQYQIKCLNNPQNIFLYTMGLQILTDPHKRMFYDASLFKINVLALISSHYDYSYIEEWELIPFIEWLNNFKDFFYDTKYFTNDIKYNRLMEKWYDIIEQIIEQLKSYIKTFYLT